jgi:hypothetical protein
MALLAPLAVGSPLGGFTISGISHNGVIRIELTRDGRQRALGVALGQPYTVFYFGSDGGGDLDDAVNQLRELLRHSSAPVPPGLIPLR